MRAVGDAGTDSDATRDAIGTWSARELTASGDAPTASDGVAYAHAVGTSDGTDGEGRATTYAFGGADGEGRTNGETRAMDCETRKWTRLATKGRGPTKRMGAAATVTARGRLFVHGGVGEDGKYLADAYELNLDTLTWREVKMNGSAPTARAFHTVSALSTMLVCYGGDNGTEFLRETYFMRYDDDVWREPDAAAYVGDDSENVCWPCERACHTATPLSDGDTLIVFGGLSKNNVSLSDTWAWSATELCWSPVEPPSQEPDARFMHTATVVGDGLVVLGGMTLNLKGVDSGKSHRVFDHMYILTGLQLLTHPTRKTTQGKPNDSPPQRSTRKSFSQEHPEGLPPKKKHSAAVKEMQRKSSGESAEIVAAAVEAEAAAEPEPEAERKAKAAEPKPSEPAPSAQKTLSKEPSTPNFFSKEAAAELERSGRTRGTETTVNAAPLAKKPKARAPKPKKNVAKPASKSSPPPMRAVKGPAPAHQTSSPPAPATIDVEKRSSVQVVKESTNVARTSADKRDIPVPGVKLAPPDDVDEDEIDLFSGPVNVSDHINDETENAPTPEAPAPVKVAATAASIPGVKLAPPDDDEEVGVVEKSTPSPQPVVVSPTKKSATRKAAVAAKVLPIPGVRLAPVDDDEWEDMDPEERMHSFQTSSDQEAPTAAGSDSPASVQVPPYEWVPSDDQKFSILKEKATGKEVRRIPLPECLRDEEYRERREQKQPASKVQPAPAPVEAKEPQPSSTKVVAEPLSVDADIAFKVFATFQLTKSAALYEGMRHDECTKALQVAWRNLTKEERDEWLDMARGPPSARKRKDREGDHPEEEDAKPSTSSEDDPEAARLRRVAAAHLNMQVRAEAEHAAGAGDFRGADVTMLGEYVTGVVTGGFDAGYFATVSMQTDDGPRNYRAVLFSPVLCSQRLLPSGTNDGDKRPTLVLPSYCVPGTSNSVARNIVFTREDASDGAIRADAVWGHPLPDVPSKPIVALVDEDADRKLPEDRAL